MSDYATELLGAVAVLHERGYGNLRIFPVFYATGHWRVQVNTPTENVLRYTSGRVWDFFDDGHKEPRTAEQIADRFEEISELATARGSAPAYEFWYKALLSVLDGRVPFMQDDYSSPERDGYVGISPGARGTGPLAKAFPLPPA